ncbi:unnamed protein product [Adineta steineri]|uniref:Uncharacterized protein n=3 Tax=Adineta steineri TaxID=433720 RepID=A0A818SUT1_9BILA|nr:unnamed protein product [Adineta steineri]
MATIDRITSLCLSDDDDTPGKIDLFFSYGFLIRQFINLQSLFLCNIRSEQMMDKIMLDLPYLSNLTYLTFEECYFPGQNNQDKAISYVNSIWNIPKLVSCTFKVQYKYQKSHHFVNKYRRDNSLYILPTVTSSTLKCLSFIGLEQCDIMMDQLFIHTPSLRRLLINKCVSITRNPSTMILSMTTLILIFSQQQQSRFFTGLLQNMPNLLHLKVKADQMYGLLIAQQWEQIIHDYIPKLKRLQFKIGFNLHDWQSQKEQVNGILAGYRSPFWLVERHWFVQCDWNSDRENACLYTLPYAFDNFQFSSPIVSQSTIPYDNNSRSYDCVHNLMYKPRLYYLSSPPHIQFFNIQHLSIEFPVTAHFWSIIPKLDHLISLDVLSNDHDEICQQQLQDLLDRAPRLTSIRISWKTLTSPLMQLFNSQNLSVYQLELLCYGKSLNNEQCIALNSIIPGIHCKVLKLNVANRTCILDLVNTLNHLHALNVECYKDRFSRRVDSPRDELCEWLQEQLSSTFSTTKISRQDDTIRLWIR